MKFDKGVVYVAGEISGYDEESESFEEMEEEVVKSFHEVCYSQRGPEQDNTGDTLWLNLAGIDQKVVRDRMRVD